MNENETADEHARTFQCWSVPVVSASPTFAPLQQENSCEILQRSLIRNHQKNEAECTRADLPLPTDCAGHGSQLVGCEAALEVRHEAVEVAARVDRVRVHLQYEEAAFGHRSRKPTTWKTISIGLFVGDNPAVNFLALKNAVKPFNRQPEVCSAYPAVERGVSILLSALLVERVDLAWQDGKVAVQLLPKRVLSRVQQAVPVLAEVGGVTGYQ